MTVEELRALKVGDRVWTDHSGQRDVLCVVTNWPFQDRGTWFVSIRRVDLVSSHRVNRDASRLILFERRDSFTANVYADWLEENGEPQAAVKLRAAFPISPPVEAVS